MYATSQAASKDRWECLIQDVVGIVPPDKVGTSSSCLFQDSHRVELKSRLDLAAD